MDAGRVVKGVKFVDIRDAGDPVEIAKRYDSELNNLPLKIPHQLSKTYSSYHLYPICISVNELFRLFLTSYVAE